MISQLKKMIYCFNPYCNGISKRTGIQVTDGLISMRFNPYCNGISKRTWRCQAKYRAMHRFNPYCNGISKRTHPEAYIYLPQIEFQSLL